MKTSVTIFKFKPKFLHFYVFITRNNQKEFFKVINNKDERRLHFFIICCLKTFKVLSLIFLYYISLY